MGRSIGKKARLAGLLLFVIVFIGAARGLRKETYLLNRNVRLVCLRILKYEELSLHRGSTYRVQFGRDEYRISALPPGPDKSWQEVAAFSYEGSVEAATPGFTILLNEGGLVSYQMDAEREKLRSSMILYFFHKNNPSHRRGIMFRLPGEWRAL
jgi:hypothetical protein